MSADPADVVSFWVNAGPKRWFVKDPDFDQQIRSRFEALHMSASRGDLQAWTSTAEGALALLILLDQFPRNMFRGSAHAFATDPLALATAREAIDRGLDRQVDPQLRAFFYLPFEHSELMENQDRAVALFEGQKQETGEAAFLPWAIQHRDIIARFGRFPHRNACLGRRTTAEEQAFLDAGGFAG